MHHKYSIAITLLILTVASGVAVSQDQGPSGTTMPKPRKYHSFVYHDSSRCVLLLSGLSKSRWTADLMDMWSYDVQTGRWDSLGICEPLLWPDTSNTFTCAAYDSKSNQVITFDFKGQTWSYHLEDNTWHDLRPSGSPPARFGQAMVYDSESDRVIMFGGLFHTETSDKFYGDTWAYDYNTNTWKEMHPVVAPSARSYAAVAYDSKLDRVVMFGGRLMNPLSDNAMWAYDFNTDSWSRNENVGGPATLTYAAMVYRTVTEDFLLYGGAVLQSTYEGKPNEDTWTYALSSNKWKRLDPPLSPPPLANHVTVYVPGSGAVVLFGGELEKLYSDKLSNTVWLFDPELNDWLRPGYGDVFAVHSSVDKSFASPDIDHIAFRTGFSNMYHHGFTARVIYASTDMAVVDSVIIFDDGLHNDGSVNDGIYGAWIPSPLPADKFFTISVSAIDNSDYGYSITPNVSRFTTAGPVTVDSVKYVQGRGYVNLKPYVKNGSFGAIVSGAKVKIHCDDPWVKTQVTNENALPEMNPGASAGCISWNTLSYDESLAPDSLYFNLSFEIMKDGWTYWTDSKVVTGVNERMPVPLAYSLEQNYPNPFNPVTAISYQLPVVSHVTLKVYDVLGREVKTLVNEVKRIGSYEVRFDASGLSSGVYFYRIAAGNFTKTMKLMVLK